MNEYLVYKHTSPNGKVYIGQTCQKPEARFNHGRGYRECPYFYSAILKYGWENIEHEIIAFGLTHKEANKMECDLIARYKSNDPMYGYNLTNGGSAEFKLTEQAIEAKKKASVEVWKRPGKKELASERMRGERNPMYGKTMSAESRRKMSIAKKGKKLGPMSEDHKAKLSKIRKQQGNFRAGTHHTPDAKRRISEANKGRTVVITEESRKKISAALSGKKKSEEGRERIRNANRLKAEKRKKPVMQIDAEDGRVIQTYKSVIDAARAMGKNQSTLICECCKGKVKTAYGFVWMYST